MSTDPREFEHPIDECNHLTPNELPTVLGVGSLAPEAIEAAKTAMQTVTPPPGVTKADWLAEHRGWALLAGAIAAAAPFIQAEERARVIQAVHDAAELEPEERDGPHLLVEAALWITVGQLNNLHGIQDGMDWVRYTATDYANQTQQAKAEALREAADDILAEKCGDNYAPNYCETCRAVETLRARAATIEGKSA